MTNGLSRKTTRPTQEEDRFAATPSPVATTVHNSETSEAMSSSEVQKQRLGQEKYKEFTTGEGCQQNLPRKKNYLGEIPSNLPGEHQPEPAQLEGNRPSGIRRKTTEHITAKAADQPTAGEKATATHLAETGQGHWVVNVRICP